ncbi:MULTISPECIES: hypothetical protein [Psychrilyobacter]|uniref:Uncharacterized protein n=1 Tax=Psychrilyobacter piezotolerans TaxID=2293438 RepID=A0ABX9KK49_9FUSO|nr:MULTISPECIES: hypothetical protein [Psychrilyobacter]MCS5420584.1 hypothetical protein [Psychrilyobacter sp. S5]NDI76621.1 hypothetical protein [Psychrilyobacter piezotolerans]RDE65249.1 hypothetical protein DV867_01585 [Psychrilyobacter sp. S5]REI42867.1 hypothetical protein DYH56_01585 [Psychrilyobacter piezotolerans]
MKKKILLFFILKTLLFSSSDFITSNGELSFKYNEKYNKITRFNGNMETYKTDIDSLEVGIYYKGEHYLLSDYIISKRFIPQTNIFETVAKLPYGKIKTTYIPSMVDKNSFYIINNYEIKKGETLEFLYLFNMSDRNGIIEYKKTKDYYKYNENIYIKNLKNSMAGYIVPASELEVVKLKKIEDSSIKYRDQRMVMSSKVRLSDGEKSDIVQIRYGKTPDFLSFESSERLLFLEKTYWMEWLKPIPFKVDTRTRKIVERFLIYLKTSTDGFDYYTNIGLRETSKTKDVLYTAMTFIKYGYLDDAEQILTRLVEKEEEEFFYLSRTKLTIEEVQEAYVYLSYLKESDDTKFYTEYIEKIQKKIHKIVEGVKQDLNKKNILEKGYEFKIYYYTYNLLKLYREIDGDRKYAPMEEMLKNYLFKNFISGDGIKKYALDKKNTYSKWEYLLLYDNVETKRLIDKLYSDSIFKRYPYFSSEKSVDVEVNLSLLGGLYLNDLSRFGDINLLQLNEDIEGNSMKIPDKIYLKGGKRYEVNGIDIYLSSKYLNTVYDRSEE